MLLFRGANKTIENYNSQTAHQVAIIAGNMALAEIIKLHDSKDIGRFWMMLYHCLVCFCCLLDVQVDSYGHIGMSSPFLLVSPHMTLTFGEH